MSIELLKGSVTAPLWEVSITRSYRVCNNHKFCASAVVSGLGYIFE